NFHKALARRFVGRCYHGDLLAVVLPAVQWRCLGIQRHLPAHMASPDAVLHRGSAIPRKDRSWRSFLDGGLVRRRLVGAAKAVNVEARSLAEIRLRAFPQRFGSAGKVV